MMFCLKNLPSLLAGKDADVPDQADTYKSLLNPEASAIILLLSGAVSLNLQSPTVLLLTGNSPVKSTCEVNTDFIAKVITSNSYLLKCLILKKLHYCCLL